MLTHVHVNYITLTLSPLHGYSITPDYCYFIYLYHRYTDIDNLSLVSCSTPNTPEHWTLYIMYTLVTLDTVISCARISVTQILLHWTLLFHIHVPLIHEYAISQDIIILYILCSCTTNTRIRYSTRHRCFIYFYYCTQILCTQLFLCSYNIVT